MKPITYYIISIFMALGIVFIAPASVAATENVAGEAAELAYTTRSEQVDDRVLRLSSYLATHNSPLVASAQHFVDIADKYNLDWRLVAAIAGLESTFGRFIPPGSYNGWGWGIPTGHQSGIGFSSWNEGIEAVSKGLRENYLNRGAETIEQIGAKYAASPTWASKVRYFMQQIEDHKPTNAEYIDTLTL